MLFHPFRAFPRVGQGVGQAVDPHFDLLITNQLLYRLSYTSVFLKDE